MLEGDWCSPCHSRVLEEVEMRGKQIADFLEMREASQIDNKSKAEHPFPNEEGTGLHWRTRGTE